MKLWKFNKRSSTLADMSMNRVLLNGAHRKRALSLALWQVFAGLHIVI